MIDLCKKLFLATALCVGFSTVVVAAGDDVSTRNAADQSFEEAVQSASDAIVNRGFKIDYTGFIGDMLDRTAEDVGASKKIYNGAQFFTFCSAVVSRKVMEAEAADIAYCPYVVFVYEETGSEEGVTIGFRQLPAGGARDQVNDLLTEIIEAAADGF
ncbi:MAG: hypothetical protein ACPGSC_04975 [Granulosicoccaceae bacterium]